MVDFLRTSNTQDQELTDIKFSSNYDYLLKNSKVHTSCWEKAYVLLKFDLCPHQRGLKLRQTA